MPAPTKPATTAATTWRAVGVWAGGVGSAVVALLALDLQPTGDAVLAWMLVIAVAEVAGQAGANAGWWGGRRIDRLAAEGHRRDEAAPGVGVTPART